MAPFFGNLLCLFNAHLLTINVINSFCWSLFGISYSSLPRLCDFFFHFFDDFATNTKTRSVNRTSTRIWFLFIQNFGDGRIGTAGRLTGWQSANLS
jgi:hypothetical protein